MNVRSSCCFIQFEVQERKPMTSLWNRTPSMCVSLCFMGISPIYGGWEGGEAEVTEHEHKLTNKRHKRILRAGIPKEKTRGQKRVTQWLFSQTSQGNSVLNIPVPRSHGRFVESEFLGIKPDKDIL